RDEAGRLAAARGDHQLHHHRHHRRCRDDRADLPLRLARGRRRQPHLLAMSDTFGSYEPRDNGSVDSEPEANGSASADAPEVVVDASADAPADAEPAISAEELGDASADAPADAEPAISVDETATTE